MACACWHLFYKVAADLGGWSRRVTDGSGTLGFPLRFRRLHHRLLMGRAEVDSLEPVGVGFDKALEPFMGRRPTRRDVAEEELGHGSVRFPGPELFPPRLPLSEPGQGNGQLGMVTQRVAQIAKSPPASPPTHSLPHTSLAVGDDLLRYVAEHLRHPEGVLVVEVHIWTGWYRHWTLSRFALAVLRMIRARAAPSPRE